MYSFVLLALLLAPQIALSASSSPARDLTPYLEMLSSPKRAWNIRSAKQGPAEMPLNEVDSQTRGELEAMIETYAPRIWWHRQDPYPPMDPLQFISESSLHSRSVFGHEKTITPQGKLLPTELTTLAPQGQVVRPYQDGIAMNGAGYFLRHHPAVDSAVPKDLSKNDYRAVPILWRLGRGPLSGHFSQNDSSHSKVLIEYWYHVAYNWATAAGIGNHQGDWEGVAMLIDLRVENGHLRHRLLAGYFSEHESGTWLCATNMAFTPDGVHPVAYSAAGTHATYPTPGPHRSAVLTDQTEQGWSWDSWKNVKPLALEPYYGFPGAWGEPRGFSFMTGPLVPGPGYKYLPRDSEKEAARTYASLTSRCQLE